MKDIPRTLLIGLLALTVLRLVLAATAEVSADEAYYTMWSERPDISYYSKGPGVASSLWMTTGIFGKNALGVRILAPLLALGSSLIIFRLGRSMFDPLTASWAVVLLNITPIFNAGSVVFTIDPLSIFFWLGTMLALWIALHRSNPWHPAWFIAGASIAIGFICKYTAAIQLLSVGLALAACPRWRAQFKRPGPYIILFVALLGTIPVLMWNSQHDWITVTHLKERGSLDESRGIHPTQLLEYLGVHLGVYSPFIFVGLMAALVAGTRRFFKNREEAFLIAFSLPIIGLYFALSLREMGEANWTSPGFVGIAILLAHYWQHTRMPGPRKALFRHLAVWTAVILSATMLHTDNLRRLGIDWPYPKDPSKRLLGWQETANTVEQITKVAARDLGEDVFLIANKYQTAAALAFYMDDDLPIIRPNKRYPPVHGIESPIPANQFSFWPRYDSKNFDGSAAPGETADSPFLGKTALYITDEPERQRPPTTIRETFRQYEVTAIVDVMRRGQVLRTIKVFACFDYKPLPL